MEHIKTSQSHQKAADRKSIVSRLLVPRMRRGAGLALVAVVLSGPSVLADEPTYQLMSPDGTMDLITVPANPRYTATQAKPRYHAAVSDRELEGAVRRFARDNRLPPALLLAVMKAESDFNPMAISKAGAVGLMQLIPETAIRHGVRNLYDTSENIAGGAKHLRYLLDRFHGNVRLALAAYNAGERHVERYQTIPPFKETRTYVKKVIGYYRDYRASGLIEIASSLEPLVGRLKG